MLGEMLITQGDILLTIGRTGDAVQSFMESIEVAQEFQTRMTELKALTRLTTISGDPWAERLRQLYETFTEGFELPDLTAARTALGEKATPDHSRES